ncbi:hypothetical protein KXM95_001668, partial [Campylobacter jejuni]|nr:hypothetical protein [Campylobacter jejuni]
MLYFFQKKEKCIGKDNLDTLTNWFLENKNQFGGIEYWSKEWWHDKNFQNEILQAQNFQPNFDIDISHFKNYTKKYLLSFVKKYQKTQFYLIIPSYSRLNYR